MAWLLQLNGDLVDRCRASLAPTTRSFRPRDVLTAWYSLDARAECSRSHRTTRKPGDDTGMTSAGELGHTMGPAYLSSLGCRLGHSWRKTAPRTPKLAALAVDPIADMYSSKVALVTGANKGIGLQITEISPRVVLRFF